MACLPQFRRSVTWLICLLAASSPVPLHARAQTPQPAPPHIDLAPDLVEYVGQYHWNSDPDTPMSVYREAGKLYEEREGRPRHELIPTLLPDRFTIAGLTTHVVFLRDSPGTVTGCRFVSSADGRVLAQETRIATTEIRLSHFRPYTQQDVMIPMRDGVHLHATILRPTDIAALPATGLPFLIQRTPYGVDDITSASVNLSKPELAASGYLFVYEDIRGRYKSEGKFIMNRPIVAHLTPNDIDETTDTYDTIAWLLKNIPGNNGRVGVLGVSYDGFLAMMAGIDPHPAVKAISPQAPMTDVWLGDDFFHNGAFRQSYGFDYVQQMEAQKTDAVVAMPFADVHNDAYDFFLKHVNFAGAAAAAKISNLPTANAFLTQPAYTRFWQDMAVQTRLAQVTVPTLEVGGFWDQEDMWGTQAEYAALQPHDPQLFLVLGPWNHGGWESSARTLGSNLGTLDLGEPTGTEYRKTFEAPFFEKYLKDKPGFDLANTATFRTGVNRWERYATWPPTPASTPAASVPTIPLSNQSAKPAPIPAATLTPTLTNSSLYLEPNKTLSFSAPVADSTPRTANSAIAATYLADPANPVPYRHRPIQSTYAPGSKWYTWLVEDQRFVTSRNDVATFTTPALDHDLTLTGEVTADLFAATTGSDADWIVKLIDVYPDAPPPPAITPRPTATPNAGYQLMVADEIFRGRYRTSFEHPQPLTPNVPTEFRWSLHAVDHTFLHGHRILVEVQSSWFPLYDRNPQTFVPNIMSAPSSAYRSETVTIYGSARFPSHLEVQTTP
jgi:predicted acyl esterase